MDRAATTPSCGASSRPLSSLQGFKSFDATIFMPTARKTFKHQNPQTKTHIPTIQQSWGYVPNANPKRTKPLQFGLPQSRSSFFFRNGRLCDKRNFCIAGMIIDCFFREALDTQGFFWCILTFVLFGFHRAISRLCSSIV